MRIQLATGNVDKVADFQAMVPRLQLMRIEGFSSLPAIEETGDSFEANARIKAEHYSLLVPGWVLADDSGLEVEALGGAPGIYSARFAGQHGDDTANNRLLLERLRGVPAERRGARFVCVLVLAKTGRSVARFRGSAAGVIVESERGRFGFGYDPLFYSPQAGCTFGELPAERKAKFSHRGQAARALIAWVEKRKDKS